MRAATVERSQVSQLHEKGKSDGCQGIRFQKENRAMGEKKKRSRNNLEGKKSILYQRKKEKKIMKRRQVSATERSSLRKTCSTK